MARLSDLNADNFTAEQRDVRAEIAGSRGGVARGPFSVWLRTPRIAVAASRFGDALRVDGQLDRRLFELATLVAAAHWKAAYPSAAHEQAAVDQGIDPQAVEAIRTGGSPVFARDDEQLVYDVGFELMTTGTLSEESYRRALSVLGTDLLIEVVTTVAFYGVAAAVSNAFDVDVPDGKTPFSS